MSATRDGSKATGTRGAARRDRRLVRYLHGELPDAEARRLEGELGRDPALAARLSELERVWRSLEPPPAAPVPPGLGARLARGALERRRAGRLGAWLAGGARAMPAPAWGRPLVAGALTAGLALGVWLGQGAGSGPAGESGGVERGSASAAAVGAVAEVGARRGRGEPAGRAEGAPGPRRLTEGAEPGGAVEEGAAGGDPGGADPAAAASADAVADADAGAETVEWASLGDDLGDDSGLFGEPTLAEAYLQALEGGDAAWEDSVW